MVVDPSSGQVREQQGFGELLTSIWLATAQAGFH